MAPDSLPIQSDRPCLSMIKASAIGMGATVQRCLEAPKTDSAQVSSPKCERVITAPSMVRLLMADDGFERA